MTHATVERPYQRQWPSASYRVSTLQLDSELHVASALPDTWTDLLDVSAYVDGLFAMQRADGTLPLGAYGALLDIATSLQRVAVEIGRRYSPRAGDALAEVGESFAGWRAGEPMVRLTSAQCASLLDSDLIVLCGPEMNWSFRARVPLLSLWVCKLDRERTEEVGEAFGDLGWLASLYRDVLGMPDLRLGPPPRFLLAHLVLAAGAATTLPTHFARFLPEDVGCPSADGAGTSTLTYTNLYSKRFWVMSARLFEEAFGRPPRVDPSHSGRHLERWFRGHDLGHCLSTARTVTAHLRERFGRWAGVLEEALADTLGFLAAEELERKLPGTGACTCDTFVAEALRYCRRDNHRFLDSSAASLELRQLVADGAILDDGDKLTMDDARLSTSMRGLARRLVAAVLEGDDDEAEALLARSGHASGVVAGIDRLLQHCTEIADDVAYLP